MESRPAGFDRVGVFWQDVSISLVAMLVILIACLHPSQPTLFPVPVNSKCFPLFCSSLS